MPVPRQSFRWLRGEELLSSFESSSGKLRRFHTRCGSHIVADRPDQPNVLLRLGVMRSEKRLIVVLDDDWLSYPILDITEAVDIVLINRPELPPAGAGESSIRPVAAALANAVFDATGVRLRRAPLTPERLQPELA